ncbi:ParB N-terminal domain-containing protein [Natrarchaeobius sp. A-rgal3]|uniref:ParB N-terminal domain-containing protein n=1 Tax=Natrarchaeobius versutus TaxID=1679078 RepID=UPI00350FE651
MSSANPFNNALDWGFRGKYARVYGQEDRVYEGWVERVHHSRGSVILHDARVLTGDQDRDVGSVFVRIVEAMEVLKPVKRIEYLPVSRIEPSPHHDQDFAPVDDHVRGAYRDQFTGGFPVVRPVSREKSDGTHYELINGHKRIEACRRAGLEYHPVEVIEVTDEEARELFDLAHRYQAQDDEGNADEGDGDDVGGNDEADGDGVDADEADGDEMDGEVEENGDEVNGEVEENGDEGSTLEMDESELTGSE